MKGKPLVLIPEGTGHANSTPGNQRILLGSKEAMKEYVFPGMRLSEGRAILSGLLWRHYDGKLYSEAQKKIAHELVCCSPRVSVLEPGVFLLDANGLMHMGGEGKLCRNVLRTVSKLGYTEAKVGVADSAFAALLGTRVKSRLWHVVAPGKDSQFISSMSVKYLPLDDEMQAILKDLGITTIGHFAQLPLSSVTERFGDAGRHAHELALGFDRRRPSLPPLEKKFECSLEVGGAVESLNETLFVFKSVLDRITLELKQAGLCADEIAVDFFNDNELFDERTVKLIRPSNAGKFLLEVVRLSLETRPLAREFTGVRVFVSRFSDESWEQKKLGAMDGVSRSASGQADLFSESSLLLLQRLITRFGDEKVVRPQANDQYLASGSWVPVIDTQSRSHRANTSMAAAQNTSVNVDYILNRVGQRGLIGNLVLRKPASPIPVLIQLEGDKPASLAYGGAWYKIVLITTPECVSGGWWDSFVRKSCFVAVIQPQALSSLADALVVLLVNEHRTKSWSIEGIFD